MLLVLNYLFVSSLLPKDEGALWKIICRRACDWEKSFILQYENLQYWLISARNVLCTYKGPHTMSLEDVELQARYCIFLIGLHTVPDSSFHAECFQNGRSPYRPFGVRASIALLCLVFEGVQAAEIKGYESANIWACDHGFLSTMFDRLQQSPLFQSEYSMQRLQSAILRLQQAFQEEEIRVASVTPQIINFASQTEVLGYYRQAFLALDPMLLPDILAVMESATETSVSSRKHRLLDMKDRLDRGWCNDRHTVAFIDLSAVTLAFQLADMFHGTCPVECLDLAFKKVAALRQSKPDEIVVSEMFHVREFEKDYRGNILGESSVS